MTRHDDRLKGALLGTLLLLSGTPALAFAQDHGPSPYHPEDGSVSQAGHLKHSACKKCGQSLAGGGAIEGLMGAHRNCPPAPVYAPAPAEAAPADPNAPAAPADPNAPAQVPVMTANPAYTPNTAGAFGANTGGTTAGGLAGNIPVMFGDMGSFPTRTFAVRPPNGGGGGSNTAPGGISGLIRGLKFTENQTPKPIDRVFYTFNYFYNVNRDVNFRFGNNVNGVNAYRHIFGFEKAFFDSNMSVGLRLPLNTITGNSATQATTGIGKTSTALGDLNLYTKVALWENREKGNIVTAGLSISFPTGPQNFGNAQWLNSLHYIQFQPYLGFAYNWNKLYVIGFTSINVPGNSKDVTQYFNDLSIGYFLYTNPDETAFLRRIAPFVEAHVNTPLNHRDVFNSQDIAGSADVLNMSYGTSFFLGKRSLLTFGLTNPVTGPRPFALEAGVLLNVFY